MEPTNEGKGVGYFTEKLEVCSLQKSKITIVLFYAFLLLTVAVSATNTHVVFLLCHDKSQLVFHPLNAFNVKVQQQQEMNRVFNRYRSFKCLTTVLLP